MARRLPCMAIRPAQRQLSPRALAAMRTQATQAWRGDYGSRLRDGAALLTLVSETGIARHETISLTNLISEALSQRQYTSTQENAWMLLAARALSESAKATRLNVNGGAHAGVLMRSLAADALAGEPLVVANRGDEPVQAVVSVHGDSATPEPAMQKGFRLERFFYTLDGHRVALDSATGGTSTVKQNDRLVVVLRMQDLQGKGGRLLLVDRLPAGLEIENPRIVDSGDLSKLAWLKTTYRPDHSEFRNDRFMASFNLRGTGDKASKEFLVAYVVRAVSPGTFMHPPAFIEDMYRPDRYTRTAGGTLTVAKTH